MHDKKGIGARGSYECVGSAFSETCFDNTAITSDYVNNVIELFDTDPHLGIASPPPPTHAAYFRFADGDWGENYEMVCDLVKSTASMCHSPKQAACGTSGNSLLV